MKTITKALQLLVVFLLLTFAVSAQAPQKFNYQAIARNPSGAEFTGQALGIRVSIVDGSPGGTVVYQESHTVTTNNFGLFNLEIGTGTIISGTFPAIAWGSGSKYIKTEIDPAGGTNYVVAGTSQLISVPYALYAGNSGNTGATGPQGPTGTNGSNGVNGATGPTGPQGIQGPQGPAGANGADGATGPQGPAGANGADGATGPAGANGATGPAGPTGAAGANGATGADGATGPQGPAGTNGATGPSGADGATGATGATGFLQNGDSAGDTPYWDGTAWVTTSSNIFNNGANVGVGATAPASKLTVNGNAAIGSGAYLTTAAPANGLLIEGQTRINAQTILGTATTRGAGNANLFVQRIGTSFGANQSGIYAHREGALGATNGGTSFAVAQVDAAIKGYSYWGNNFTSGVYGGSFGDYANSSGVSGAISGSTTVTAIGHLGFYDGTSNWGIYTPNATFLGGAVRIPTGATLGYVLTSDAAGNATWQPAGSGPTGPQGPAGPTGAAGATGATGSVGATGADGATGAQGPAGPTGAAGATGATGSVGATGADGATGPQGPAGPTGSVGATGATGSVGVTGPAGANGATGATGADGPTGPTGATGFLQNGDSAGDTPYWDGTAWVTTSSNVFNNGGNVGVGSLTPGSKLSVEGNVSVGSAAFANAAAQTNGLTVEGQSLFGVVNPTPVGLGVVPASTKIFAENGSGVAGAGNSIIYAMRFGTPFVPTGGGTGWTPTTVDAAIKAHVLWGNNYSAGVYGHNWGDWENSAGVAGYMDDTGNSGFLAYKDAAGTGWGVYTPNDAYVGGNFQYPVGATNNYVLTSDAFGNATWQDPNTLVTIPPSTAWDLLGNAGTSPATNFIGTTDAADLVFRTSNTERARLTAGGQFGIGNVTPADAANLLTLGGASPYSFSGQAEQAVFGNGDALLALNENNQGINTFLGSYDFGGTPISFMGAATNHPLWVLNSNSFWATFTQDFTLGLGTTAPNSTDARFHSTEGDRLYAGLFNGQTESSSSHIIHSEYNGNTPSNNDVVAVYGKSVTDDFWGIGGEFEGGFIGSIGQVQPTGVFTYSGAIGQVFGAHTGTGYGVQGAAVGFGAGATNYGVYGQASSFGASLDANYGGYFTSDDGPVGAYAQTQGGAGTNLTDPIFASGSENTGLMGTSLDGTSIVSDGVLGFGRNTTAAYNIGTTGYAYEGTQTGNYGGYFSSASNSTPSFVLGLYAETQSTGGIITNAGYFAGDVTVTGNLSKGGGTFKIDHPLDPENKYLYHSFVESPDMMNVYNGNITTDANGMAVVELPSYFEAENKDFKYQLTVIGQFAQAIVAEKVKDNKFVVKTDKPNVEISWQVTGVRQDAWANKNRVVPEVEKEPMFKGYYIHPDVYGLDKSRGISSLLSTSGHDAKSSGTLSPLELSKKNKANFEATRKKLDAKGTASAPVAQPASAGSFVGANTPGVDASKFTRPASTTAPAVVTPAKAVEITPAKVVAPVERRNVPVNKGSNKTYTTKDKK
jgi:collagen type VII alpha